MTRLLEVLVTIFFISWMIEPWFYFQAKKEESDKERSPPSGEDERPKSKSPPDKSRSTITPPSRSPDKTRTTVTPPSSTNQQQFYSSSNNRLVSSTASVATTGTGAGRIIIGQTPPGGENRKSEYDDVPGENETLVPLRKPAAQHKSSPDKRSFPTNSLC